MNKQIKRRLASLLEKSPFPSTLIGPPKRASWDVPTDAKSGRVITTVETPTEDLVQPDFLYRLDNEQLRSTLIFEIKPLVVARLAEGRYFQPTFAVVDRSDTLLYDYTQGWEVEPRLNNYIFEEIKLPRARRLAGKSLLLDVRSHSQNYFHWIIEAMTKIPAAMKAGVALDDISHFLVSSPTKHFHADAFQRLGIAESRIVDVAQYPHWQCEELIAVSDTREFLYRTYIDYARDLFTPSGASHVRRLFISRSDAKYRRVSNEEELQLILKRFGFETVTLSGLTVAEQAALFAGASCIIAPHGAGLTNFLFCQPGTLVIELHSPYYLKALYWRIASAMNLRYAALLGESPAQTDTYDMSILPEVLNDTLCRLLG